MKYSTAQSRWCLIVFILLLLYPKGITNAMQKAYDSQNKPHFGMVFILSVSIAAAAMAPEAGASESKPEISVPEKNAIFDEAALLSDDLDKTYEALKALPPAITFLGGARIREEDHYCITAVLTGGLIAGYGIPVCTGGGTGIMEFIPRGYLQARHKCAKNAENPFTPVRSSLSTQAKSDDCRTQAFIIKLPREQKANLSIEVFTELRTLPIRKLALMENKRGFGIFPGGFGTMDEFYELWDLKCRGKINAPVALVGCEFWRHQLTVIEDTAVKSRSLITHSELSMVSDSTVDEPSQIISVLSGSAGSGDLETDPEKDLSQLKKDIQKASEYYMQNEDAVIFLGSPRLIAGDSACATAESVSMQCAQRGISLRTGDGGNVALSVVHGARKGAEKPELEAFLLQSDILPAEIAGLRITTVESTVIHKAFISKKMRAILVLPGDVHALSELFGVLCLMQNGIIDRKPVILLGKSYWSPLVRALKKTMCEGKRMLIAPEDLRLLTITDLPGEAMALISP